MGTDSSGDDVFTPASLANDEQWPYRLQFIGTTHSTYLQKEILLGGLFLHQEDSLVVLWRLVAGALEVLVGSLKDIH